jgi:calcineurin-like phosphoesterase family protein
MRFFTSDEHFWHNNILKYCPKRGHATVEEMNWDMVAKWNAVVKPEDEVYCLGDFSMSLRGAAMRQHLNGTVYLIPGNHDKCHQACHKNKPQAMANAMKAYEDLGFIVLPEKYSTIIRTSAGEEISAQLCHLPYKEDPNGEYTPRFQQIRPIPTFLTQILLHGHVHQHWKHKIYTAEDGNRYPMINVGVDRWDLTPVSEHELAAYAKNLLDNLECIADNGLIGVGD